MGKWRPRKVSGILKVTQQVSVEAIQHARGAACYLGLFFICKGEPIL